MAVNGPPLEPIGRHRRLGAQGLRVFALGLGCGGLAGLYGHVGEREAAATIRRAIELGIDLLDTADAYGPFTSERLLGRVLAGRRHEVILATKFGRVVHDGVAGLNGSAAHVRQACDASLERLDVEVIDLYMLHRVDPATPIEDTVGAMAELVAAGKVRFIGLSEASAETIRRAHAVHPLSAVQSEYSLWSRDVEDDVLPVLRELGIGLLAYSPLGRGFLSGGIRSIDDLREDDVRRSFPRFQQEALEQNHHLVVRLEHLARERDVTVAQLALAWVLSRGDDIVPLTGATQLGHLEQNVAALTIKLDSSDLASVEQAVPRDEVVGPRHPDPASLGR